MMFIFPLIYDASPLLVSMDMMNSSTIRLVISVEFSEALQSLTLTRLYVCFPFFNVVRMREIIRNGDILYVVGNNYIIIFLAHNTVST